jgi:hypothetical protein
MVATFTNYAQINSLAEFAFIAGTDYTLSFTVYDEDGTTPQDIGGATVTWTLSPYGQNYNVLEITGTITGTSTFDVVIPASSTETLSGKYLQQMTIDSFYSQRFRPAQGIILILPRTPLN